MGLLINVYRPAGDYDCTNGGVSSRSASLTLVNASGPFEGDEHAPAVVLEQHLPGILRIVPLELKRSGAWAMFGGNYAACCDSRFREACESLLGHKHYGAVAIHDRVEG